MNTELRCTVYPGQFSSELSVIVTNFSGREFSLFTSRSDVSCEGTPSDELPTVGWLTVRVLGLDRDRVLVCLPQSTIENGQTITVPRKDMRNLGNQHDFVEA